MAETFKITRPTDSNWEPANTVEDILKLRMFAIRDGYYGPYVLLLSNMWRPYLHMPYMPQANPELTLKGRFLQIEGIVSIERVQLLGFGVRLCQIVVEGKA